MKERKEEGKKGREKREEREREIPSQTASAPGGPSARGSPPKELRRGGWEGPARSSRAAGPRRVRTAEVLPLGRTFVRLSQSSTQVRCLSVLEKTDKEYEL